MSSLSSFNSGVIAVVVLLGVILFVAVITRDPSTKAIERTTFEGVSASGYGGIIFEKVWMERLAASGDSVKANVSAPLDKGIKGVVEVVVDSSLVYTAITVFPDPRFNTGPSPIMLSMDASRVIIYVPDAEAKKIWEQWLIAAEQKYREYHRLQNTPIPTRVIPEEWKIY